MKMVKSLLLGSAAGLVALTGAQAADLPVKAKAVEYVKICSAYGAGFYYIPGTDICLRVGGYVRADYYAHERAGAPLIYSANLGNDMVYNRDDNGTTYRARGVAILDARTNTAYGTLRSYIAFGATYDTASPGVSTVAGATVSAATQAGVGDFTVYLERAFIQFAGFTFGYTVSFFDVVPNYGFTYIAGIPARWPALIAYTANFGGGWTASLSLENATSRRGEIQAFASNTAGVTIGNANAGHLVPDIIANIRADQAWGSFQLSGVAHNIRPGQAIAAVDDKWGYAVGSGVEIKTPSIGAKDSATLSGVWSKGAYDFTGIGQQTNTMNANAGIGQVNNLGIGPVGDLFDALVVNGAGGNLELVTAWSIAGQFRHFWTPMLRSSVGLGYFEYKPGTQAHSATFDYPKFTMWQLQSTHIWSPVKDLDLGVEVIYSHMKTDGAGQACGAIGGALDNELCESKGVLSGMFRAQRNF